MDMRRGNVYKDISKTPICKDISTLLANNKIDLYGDNSIDVVITHAIESIIITSNTYSNKGGSVFVVDDDGNPIMKFIGRMAKSTPTIIFNDDKPKAYDIIISRSGVMKGKKDIKKEFLSILNNVTAFDGARYMSDLEFELIVAIATVFRNYLLSRKKGGIRLSGVFTTNSNDTSARLDISSRIDNICRCIVIGNYSNTIATYDR